MIRRPPRSTQSRSSAASDVYKRQKAGCIARLWLNQRHLDRSSARQISCPCRPADAAADDGHSRLLASRDTRGERREARCSRKVAELATCPAVHGRSDPLCCTARYSASAAISSVLSERATTFMIWLTRLPDLKASIVSTSFFGSSPMIVLSL